jgi:hypothetical protein
MDKLVSKTRNLKNEFAKKLDEMDKIFFLTKNFSVHFDGHIKKLHLMILTLLEAETEDYTPNNLKNQEFINKNRLFFNEEEIKESNFNDKEMFNFQNNLLNLKHQQSYSDINKTIEEDEEKYSKNEKDLEFLEIFKEQNNHLNKMMQFGEENSKTLREMLNSIYEAFLNQHKNNDNQQIIEKYRKKKENSKKTIEQLQKEIFDLKLKLNEKDNLIDSNNNEEILKKELENLKNENIKLRSNLNLIKKVNFDLVHNLSIAENNLKMLNSVFLDLRGDLDETKINLRNLKVNPQDINPKMFTNKFGDTNEKPNPSFNSFQNDYKNILEQNSEMMKLINEKMGNSNRLRNSNFSDDNRSFEDNFSMKNFNKVNIKNSQNSFQNVITDKNENLKNSEYSFNAFLPEKNDTKTSQQSFRGFFPENNELKSSKESDLKNNNIFKQNKSESSDMFKFQNGGQESNNNSEYRKNLSIKESNNSFIQLGSENSIMRLSSKNTNEIDGALRISY